MKRLTRAVRVFAWWGKLGWDVDSYTITEDKDCNAYLVPRRKYERMEKELKVWRELGKQADRDTALDQLAEKLLKESGTGSGR